MSKRSRRQSAKIDPDLARRIPRFESEAEEAAFWDDNRDLIFELLKRHGEVVRPRVVEKTRSVTLRIPESDLERAKSIAETTGKPYQRVLKDAMREGLKRVS
jgi:predicted DNA binding CopG/RHH family protein